MSKQSVVEKLLFEHPLLYRLKRFIIEDIIWQVILCGIFRLKRNPLSDVSSKFSGRSVLVAACGPGDVTTGPRIVGAAQVTAFDLSRRFVESCAKKRKEWNVYCGDLCNIAHPDNTFDISVIYQSLHHIPVDAKNIFGELTRVTSDQIIVVESMVPSKGILRPLLLLWFKITDGGCHYYTLEELEKAVKHLGLRVKSSNLCSPIKHVWLGVIDCRGV